MIKFTDIKNKIKPGNLTFLVLTISLVLSSVVIPNDIVDYGNANVPNASHVGSRNFNIKFNETQSIVYDTKNVTINKGGTSGFDVNYTGWVSDYIDMKVSNITDKESHNLVRQDLANASTNRTIPMYGTNYTLVDGGNTYEFKPQEVGTNFVLDSPAYISNVYLALGFHILYNGTHDNLAETKNMINNATIEIRKDQSDTPVIDQHIKSIPLRDCIVNWTEDAEYINQTIGNAIDTNPSMDKYSLLLYGFLSILC